MKLRVEEVTGDIFDAPDDTVIIHACNCYGRWGAGIAKAFKDRYPEAFIAHQQYCQKKRPDSLIGTAQLIKPLDDGPRHHVGCLFTSKGMGRAKDSPNAILKNTGPAMESLIEKIIHANREGAIKEVRICQINSGLFAVPWEKTRAVLEDIDVDGDRMPGTLIVYSLGDPSASKSNSKSSTSMAPAPASSPPATARLPSGPTSSQENEGIGFSIAREQQNFRLLELPPELVDVLKQPGGEGAST